MIRIGNEILLLDVNAIQIGAIGTTRVSARQTEGGLTFSYFSDSILNALSGIGRAFSSLFLPTTGRELALSRSAASDPSKSPRIRARARIMCVTRSEYRFILTRKSFYFHAGDRYPVGLQSPPKLRIAPTAESSIGKLGALPASYEFACQISGWK